MTDNEAIAIIEVKYKAYLQDITSSMGQCLPSILIKKQKMNA